MNLNEIQDLIKFVSKSGVTEVEIEQKDFITCDQANLKIFNLSLTTWNFIISLMLFLLVLTSLVSTAKPTKYRRGKWL